MLADAVEKHFEGRAIVEIFSGMNFVAEIDAGVVKGVENWEPAFREFVESGFDKDRRDAAATDSRYRAKLMRQKM